VPSAGVASVGAGVVSSTAGALFSVGVFFEHVKPVAKQSANKAATSSVLILFPFRYVGHCLMRPIFLLQNKINVIYSVWQDPSLAL
jgi:hypothetical protein